MPPDRKEFDNHSPITRRRGRSGSNDAPIASPRSAAMAVKDRETIAGVVCHVRKCVVILISRGVHESNASLSFATALRRELNERQREVEEHDARHESEIEKLHKQMETLETQLKAAKAAEADQSDIWREKATIMVEKLTADAREETDFWKNKSSETIEKA